MSYVLEACSKSKASEVKPKRCKHSALLTFNLNLFSHPHTTYVNHKHSTQNIHLERWHISSPFGHLAHRLPSPSSSLLLVDVFHSLRTVENQIRALMPIGWACLRHFLYCTQNLCDQYPCSGGGSYSTGVQHLHRHHLKEPHTQSPSSQVPLQKATEQVKVFREHFPSTRLGSLTTWCKTLGLSNVTRRRGQTWRQIKGTTSASSKPIHSSCPCRYTSCPTSNVSRYLRHKF